MRSEDLESFQRTCQTAPGHGPTFEMVKSEILDPGNVGMLWHRTGFVFPMCSCAKSGALSFKRGVPPLIQAPSWEFSTMPLISANLERLSWDTSCSMPPSSAPACSAASTGGTSRISSTSNRSMQSALAHSATRFLQLIHQFAWNLARCTSRSWSLPASLLLDGTGPSNWTTILTILTTFVYCWKSRMRHATAVFTPTLNLKKNSFLAYLLFFDNENPVYISSRVCCFSSPWILLDVICLHPAITFVLLTGTGYTNNTVIPFLIKVIAGTSEIEGSERDPCVGLTTAYFWSAGLQEWQFIKIRHPFHCACQISLHLQYEMSLFSWAK